MPELPEVETTLRGIRPYVLGKSVRTVTVRDPRLRWRVPAELARELGGQTVRRLERRGKYLLFTTDDGCVILHLGMSGSLRVTRADEPPGKFDHVDIVFESGDCLRLRDPRRFGAVLWTHDIATHRLLRHLGPEPLNNDFNGDYLFARTRKRKRAIRDFLLDGRQVAGIGNIYANEALFAAQVRPTRAAGRLRRDECDRLVRTIRATLKRAIRAGGTTLRDFRGASDRPGYFQQRLKVYGREARPCPICSTPVRLRRLGQRSAFFCPRCQF
ncbi:MAG TPA: bifunctional DNA-formamidopyrimidine glycosylase/DNA-(apurinic or apyrimidinic site) lyase [Burkholderiales bacterium]|nr:bifunctional DNA-formamidopyrimidine glycosylase/DNA-(apurinic or apyrimidinic site) lyase [Burkholderiales bacterium]